MSISIPVTKALFSLGPIKDCSSWGTHRLVITTASESVTGNDHSKPSNEACVLVCVLECEREEECLRTHTVPSLVTLSR